MELSAQDLPRDVDALMALVLSQRADLDRRTKAIAEHEATIAEHEATIAGHQATIAKLEHLVARLQKWIWGPRTEKQKTPVEPIALGTGYLPFLEIAEAAQRLADTQGAHGSLESKPPSEEQPPAKQRSKRRSEFPAHLPRVRTTVELPEQDRMCCGKPMEAMAEQVTRELERIEFAVVHEVARKKYCCRVCQVNILTAPAPARALDKALLGNGWLASLVVERFGNHMPYHRLEQKYASEGLDLSRSVMCRSCGDLSEGFEPVVQALREEVVAEGVVFADETTTRTQESKGGGPKGTFMWLYANRLGDCVFDYSESRGRDSPARMLAGVEGYLHADGYSVYESLSEVSSLKHVACWVHARRYFVDAQSKHKDLAREAIDWIAKLFAVEQRAKEAGLSADAIRELRQQESVPILRGFRDWLEVTHTKVLPQSPMAEAIKYVFGRWEALNRFLEDGRLELDNNRSERAVRAVAIGRKNWNVIGNERGGRTASVFYSLIVTCKERGIDPRTYLRDAMVRLKEGVDPRNLTPRQWQVRYAAEVDERRSYVLAKVLGQLAG
jgi:transposase